MTQHMIVKTKRTVKPAEIRRGEIIKAAAALFKSHDFKKLTMQDLMEKLQLSKGALYHHFPSKQHILEAVLDDFVEDYLEKQRRCLKENAKLSPLDQFKCLMVSSRVKGFERLLENFDDPENYKLHATYFARVMQALAPLYAGVIAEGCKTGVFETKYPLEAAELLLSGIQFMTDRGFYHWSNETLVRRGDAIATLVETQLGAAQGSFSFMGEP